MTIYERIDKLRNEKHLSRRKLARLAGIPETTLASAFARRPEYFPSKYVIKIANALNVDPGELVAGWPGLKIIDKENPVTPDQRTPVPSANISTKEHLCIMIDNMDDKEISDISSILGAYTSSNANGRKSIVQYAWEVKQISDYHLVEDQGDR